MVADLREPIDASRSWFSRSARVRASWMAREACPAMRVSRTRSPSEKPAAEAGLEEGDVIVRVGDRTVAGAADLTAAIRSHSPGDTVEVAYVRNGNERTVDVTLDELPD